MALTRRQLLKYSGLGFLGAVVFAGCRIPDREFIAESPVMIPEDLVYGDDNYFATLARPNTGVESVLVRVMQGRAKKVEGNPDYPMSRGKHSAQAEATLQELYHPDRIATPLRRVGERGAGEFESISWDEALNELQGKLSEFMVKPDAVAISHRAAARGARHGCGPVRRELRRTALLLRGRRPDGGAYGLQPHVRPGPAADLRHPERPLRALLRRRLPEPLARAAPLQLALRRVPRGDRRARQVLVQVEPRFSLTAANADKWVYVNPGTEGVLAIAIAQTILDNGDGDLDMMAALKETINVLGPAHDYRRGDHGRQGRRHRNAGP